MLGTITNFIVDTRSNGDDSATGPVTSQDRPSSSRNDWEYVTEDQLLERFVNQLEERELTAEHRRVLQRQLGGHIPNSIDARITHIQSKLARFEAYADSIESFIDENGSGRDLLNELRAEMAAMSDDLDELTAQITRIESEQHSLRDGLEELRESHDQLDESVDELTGRHGREIAGVDAKVHWVEEELEEELDEIRTDVSNLKAFRRGFLEAVQPQTSGEAGE